MLNRFSVPTFSAVLLCALVPAAATAQNAPSTQASHVPGPTARVARQDAAYGRRSMTFEQNRGQADARVPLLAHGSNYSVLLSPAQATLVVHQEKGPAAELGKARMTGKQRTGSQQTMSMALVGADAKASLTGERRLPGYVNYLSGSDRSQDRTGIPTFAAARVRRAYPGIDLLYYGTDRQLEFDFEVSPGMDAGQIKLRFAGAKPLLDAAGSLHLRTGRNAQPGEMSFLKPVIYQQSSGRREPVDGSFTVATNGEVSFRLGTYDHSRELVIDPIISYASYFGGSGEDEINASTLNAANQLYAVGQTHSLDLPATSGEFQPANTAEISNNNFHGAFVTKFSADGSAVLWTTYLGGNGDSFATGIAVNATDQPYVVGYTNACGSNGTSYLTPGEFPFTSDAVQPLCNPQAIGFNNYETNGGGYDAYLVKLSSDGKTELYGTPLGGSANDFASSVVLDAVGKVYIVGETISTQSVVPGGNSRTTPVPNYPGGVGTANYPTTSNAFYLNTTESRMNASKDPNNGDSFGTQDEQAFLTVLSPDLHSLVYSSLIGGPVLGNSGNGTSSTNGIALAVNANGIVYIGGNTSSAHWPVTAGALAPTCANAGQANSTCNLTGWLAAFNPGLSGNASLLFTTYLNGVTAGTSPNAATIFPGSDVFGLATDSAGNVIVTGDTNAVDFPTTPATLQPACFKFGDGNGNSGVCSVDGFVSKLSSTGALLWSTYLGPNVKEGSVTGGRGVAVDSSSNVYLLASTNSSVLPTKNSITGLGGGPDAYLAELNPTASSLLMGTYLGAGGGIGVNNNSLHLDSNLSAYFAGYQGVNPYGGTSFPTTPSAFSKTIQGNDGFVVKMITQQQPSSATLTASPSGNVTPAQSVKLTATVTSAATLTGIPTAPIGTVQFLNGGTMLGTGTLAAGSATYTGTLPAGTDSLTAVYAGDSGFKASTSSTVTVVVSSAVATSTTLTVSPSTATFGQTVTLTSTTAADTTPVTAGTVTFSAGNVTLATATVGANGTATATVTPAVGMYAVVASYAGTASGTNPTGSASSVSANQPLTISKASAAVAVAASTALAPVGGSVTLTARVGSTAGTPTGTVNFLNGSTLLGSATLASGVATFTSTTLPAGTYSVSAAYAGDTNFTAATSTSSAPLVVRAPAPTALALTSSALNAPVKTAITLTAKLTTSTASGTPSGTVTFYAGTAMLGTSTLANNSASFTTSTLGAGSASLTAVYSGDTLFLTSTSSAITETITNPTLTLSATPNPLIIQHGHSGVLNLTLTPSGGFAGTVTFGCGPLPSYVSCVFAPPTLVFSAASSTAQTDALTIYTSTQLTASNRIPPLFNHGNAESFAMLFWLPGSALALFGLRRKTGIRQHRKSVLMLVLLVSAMGAAGALTGCGSSNSFKAAAPGSYSVTLNITNSDGSVQTINAPVTIQ